MSTLDVARLASLNDVAMLGTFTSIPVTTNGFTPFFLLVSSAQD